MKVPAHRKPRSNENASPSSLSLCSIPLLPLYRPPRGSSIPAVGVGGGFGTSVSTQSPGSHNLTFHLCYFTKTLIKLFFTLIRPWEISPSPWSPAHPIPLPRFRFPSPSRGPGPVLYCSSTLCFKPTRKGKHACQALLLPARRGFAPAAVAFSLSPIRIPRRPGLPDPTASLHLDQPAWPAPHRRFPHSALGCSYLFLVFPSFFWSSLRTGAASL